MNHRPSPFALLPSALLWLCLAGCCYQPAPRPAPRPAPIYTWPANRRPPLDLALQQRHLNYGPQGSCLWAACQDVLVWQGKTDEAAWWAQHCAGGAIVPPYHGVPSPAETARDRRLMFAYTTAGDEGFLEWCSRTRRGAAIHWIGARTPGAHAVTFAGFDSDEALLIDNNRPHEVQRLPRERFLETWRASGGGAITFLYDPLPPRPAGQWRG